MVYFYLVEFLPIIKFSLTELIKELFNLKFQQSLKNTLFTSSRSMIMRKMNNNHFSFFSGFICILKKARKNIQSKRWRKNIVFKACVYTILLYLRIDEREKQTNLHLEWDLRLCGEFCWQSCNKINEI